MDYGDNSAYGSDKSIPEDDGKIACPCGCNKRKSRSSVFRHLRKKSKERRKNEEANLEAETGNLGDSEAMDVDTNPRLDPPELQGGNGGAMQLDDPFMNFQQNEPPSDDEQSMGSWYDVSTPPPSPPRSPVEPLQNEVLSDAEEDYQNITAEDYREYERWYGEDSQEELTEFLGETLTEEEMDSIKMLAIKQFGHISIRNYERIRYSFRHKIRLLTLKRLGTRLAKLSGIKPEEYHCCVNVCHAFLGDYADEIVCSKCGAQRYDSQKRPRKIYQYIPAMPWFQAFFNNPEMVKKLGYRDAYPQIPGAMNDFFDGQLYKDLRQRNIVIDGEDTGVKFFSGKYDIATSILSDGVQIFQHASQENATCWPIMLQILSLPPADRVQLRNLVPLCVIPGPNQPKDFDSFLIPFVNECLDMARGVKTFNALTGQQFILRQHPVLVGGDMQAIKHYEQLKGPNAKVPCRGCLTVGHYHAKQRTYYIPLASPLDPRKPATTTSSYDPLNLPLRTEENLKAQTAKMERNKNTTEYEKLGKKYGISGPSILDRIPSIQRPSSYPHEFLHLFLLNHGPNLVSLWTGKYKNISDAGCENYLISKSDWIAIGLETENATKLIPAAFTRQLPNIATSWHSYCGESWSFWLVYIGPIVLRGRLPQKYYKHYLEFVSILKCLLQLTNTTHRIEQLREEIAGYIERYEEYYYQYNYDRLCVCRLTVHALLHVAEDILRCGPASVYWSFGTERYCREVIACARSMVVPYSAVNNYVVQMSQLATVSARFAEIRKSLLFGKADAPVNKSEMEEIYPEYPEIVLRKPQLKGFLLQPNVRRRLAVHFRRTVNPRPTFNEWVRFIPERCDRWGKLRIANHGDRIRSVSATNALTTHGGRDASFVRFVHEVDKNERHPFVDNEMIEKTGYGRLDFILAITLPANPQFGINEPQLHLLAHLTMAKDADGDASTERVSYTTFSRSLVLDITAIRNVVGRVHTRSVKASGEWVIVDRSEPLCQTVFYQEELEYESGEE